MATLVWTRASEARKTPSRSLAERHVLPSSILHREKKMKKGPKFPPSLLKRFSAQCRGTGTYEQYIPWHRVNRSDPSSHGRSHLQIWHGRQRELLSDLELVAFLFSTMHPSVVDIREQFPLNLQLAQHELNGYQAGSVREWAPGTIELAERLQMKHPISSEAGISSSWIMTTDLLLTLKEPDGHFKLLAISVKPSVGWMTRRKLELLNLERQYWICRNVPWLLITPQLYEDRVADLLKSVSHWALGENHNDALLQWVGNQAQDFDRKNLTQILRRITQECGCPQTAQYAFWQAVWTGRLPFDLHRSWRASAPFLLVSPAAFWARNPIVSGRTAWDH
ncbi:TnsA endonuclease N-terminal domain-containing protein [Pseudoduganella rivuli]|uniref:TnsA endonuclease N-terminal domain-containing protein n=1 Tax=Pseudoduganella rivuli TaxID=2666085 RepID=UPI0018A1CEFA|nr:TnsA endonuclease N-terminal domain-containing protein [Pseudoduganella rivuli]